MSSFSFKQASSLLILLLLGISVQTNSQLQADFTIDKSGGCSPLSVQFSNTSTGTSTTTTYHWSLGNGNTSALFNPGATYYTEKTYTVTLKAIDGAITSTKSLDVTVYKKPVVDFSVTGNKGCVPLTSSFTANATPGDGTIAKYFWDFGDGETTEVATAATSHIYTFGQKPPVSLSVTNSFGCYTTLSKNSLVEAYKEVKAVFKPSAKTICKPGDEITFNNTSTGGGVLSYAWDFGDGKTSTEQSPKHVFSSKGLFIVKLQVKSTDGCVGDAVPDTINVANFAVDFEMPPKICQMDENVIFINKSTPGFTKTEWALDGNAYGSATDDLYITFYTSGAQKLTLSTTYGTCNVAVTKNIVVNPKPILPDFVAKNKGACGAPVTIEFSDTSKDAAAWVWKLRQYGTTFGTTKDVSYTFTTGGAEEIFLQITNMEGCSAGSARWIYYGKPSVGIYEKSFGQLNESCQGVSYTFGTWQDSIVQEFKWDFGDGGTSTEREPVHKFDQFGNFTVTLDYITTNGCKGSETYYPVRVLEKVKYDFKVTGSTTVCGNTPTTFTIMPGSAAAVWWYLNDTMAIENIYSQGYLVHKFNYDTTYTVKMIALNGQCRDTVIKKNYIKVLPPFPHIENVLNTCNGLRNEVRFTDTSYKALSYEWDFGDGTKTSYTSYKDTVRHTYPAVSKEYKAILTTTNAACTVKDSARVFIMLKQNPALTLSRTEMCASDIVDWKVTGYERNTWVAALGAYLDFEGIDIQYSDLTRAPDDFIGADGPPYLEGSLRYLETWKKGLRLIYTTTFFNCEDTTNFAAIDIHGPKAGFEILANSGCFNQPVLFRDTSKSSPGRPITEWLWSLDGAHQYVRNKGDTFSFQSTDPGQYYPNLKVTDKDGCYAWANTYLSLELTGPKANFDASAYAVPPATLVNFTNTSVLYGAGYQTQNKWIFPDGSTASNIDYVSFKFDSVGQYPVTLLTWNPTSGCTDSITKIITVRKINSAFTYTLSYINNNNCPPVIAKFTSISANAASLAWNFGDGGIGGDQKTVTHTYNQAGIYGVMLYSYDEFGNVDSTLDFIEVKGPYALLKADTLYACNTLQVKLSADVRNANDFSWDFGDGTVIAGIDTFSVHKYLTPGIYRPAVILKDQGGCSATSSLSDKIVVDSLLVAFSPLPISACNNAMVNFTPSVSSLSKTKLQATLQYRWVVKDNTTDTLLTETGSHFFGAPGLYKIDLRVQSPFGCTAYITKTVDIKAGVKAIINGPVEVCKNDTVSFKGTSAPNAANLQWQWNIGNLASSNLQDPPPQQFATTGAYTISLKVNNGSCVDSAGLLLSVRDIPSVAFSLSRPALCLGDTMQITAAGAASYQWMNTGYISNTGQASASVFALADKFYAVEATNVFGCKALDSVLVKVIKPFKVAVKTPLFACFGNTVQLNASGADSYSWSPVAGLSNPKSADPVVNIPASAIYTVVGHDKYNCFADTATTAVTIGALPFVNAGADRIVISGSDVKLLANTSNNVVEWNWQPADYLSCTNCASPVSKPLKPMVYTVVVSTEQGCTAKDTVRIELLCSKELLYIPTGFTPNGDNLNERFAVLGNGIKSIVHFVVYDRWGKTVFECKNGSANDRNSSWDGTAFGKPAPSGAYVYTMKVECDGGEIFSFQGNVTLIR